MKKKVSHKLSYMAYHNHWKNNVLNKDVYKKCKTCLIIIIQKTQDLCQFKLLRGPVKTCLELSNV